MLLTLLGTGAMAHLLSAGTPNWENVFTTYYPQMDENLGELRNYINTTAFPVTVSNVDYVVAIHSSCQPQGADSLSAPWTSYFATTFDTWSNVTVTTGGTVSAKSKGHWDLHVKNDGGEEKWRDTSTNPYSYFLRIRIDRHDPRVVYWEETLEAQGGGGG